MRRIRESYEAVFKYFENNLDLLSDKYQLEKFGHNPCSIKSIEGLEMFIKRISIQLFNSKVKFLKDKYDYSKKKVYFEFENQEMYLEIDPNYGHVELDYFKVVDFMGTISGYMICRVNPTGQYLSGYENDMVAAWSYGLPIHLPNLDFWYKNLNGERFKRLESGGTIVIGEKIEEEFYLIEFIKAINDYLQNKDIDHVYTNKQIKTCAGLNKYTTQLIVSGSYSTEWRVENGITYLKNSFANQLFLNWFATNNYDISYVFTNKINEEVYRGESILTFISDRKFEN